MKNILELATKELKSSKKMVIAMIVGIVIVTILINSITTLALSYQEYIVNLSRSKENWEAKIENVPYRDVEVIEKNENIKQISIVKDLGISEESYSEWFTDLLHIKEYDENALKNLEIKLKKGRLPQNTKEIIVNEDMTFEVGDTIDTTINNKKYSFQIVGLIENTDFDEFEATTLTKENGAITIFNSDNLNENDFVSVSIISNDVSKIYNTANQIKADINSDLNIVYNEELLGYACVAEDGSDFENTILIVVGLLIAIIAISSIALIYTIFNISISEKKKYIGSLSSIGASRKQIFSIYLIEGLVITIIAIPIGLLLSFGIDYLLVNIFDGLFKTIQSSLIDNSLLTNKIVDLHLIFSWKTLLLSIALVIIIVLLSILVPTINVSKTTIMDMIRKNKYTKIGKKTIKTPKIIAATFKIEGELAYKNIKRSHSKFITMIISLTITIVLFISINGYLSNLNFYNNLDVADYNYRYSVFSPSNERDYTKDILDMLNQFELIDNVYAYNMLNIMYIYPEEKDINDSLKNAMSKWDELYLKYYGNSDGTIRENALMWARIMMLDDKTYQEYLQSIGDSITLEKNECILVNYTDVKTKYFNELYLTNYKPGDTITITDEDISFKDEEEILEEMDNMMGWTDIEMPQKIELNLKIKEVTNVIPKGANNSIYNQIVYLVVNEETFNDLWYKIFNNKNEGSLLYNIQTSDPAKMDETVAQLNQKYEGEFRINATNFEAEKQANENEVLIKSILLYSFFGLISILSVINIFNIITSNIRLRRNEFAELKAIGMSQKQINRMLRLEGIFYGTTSIVLGLVISIIILYVLYINMLDTEIYGFTISVPLILITIILTYLVIFISIKFAKRKMKKENISDVIRENVD